MNYELLKILIQLNFLPICISIFLIYFFNINKSYDSKSVQRFQVIVVQLLVLLCIDSLDYICIEYNDTTIWHTLVVVIGYDLRLFIMAGVTDIAIERLEYSKSNYVYILAGLNALILLLTFFTDLVFEFNANGEVENNLLGYTPHIIELGYSIILIVLVIKLFYIRHKNEAELILFCLILTLLATYLEHCYDLRGLLTSVIAFTIIFYYLYIHIEHFKFDNLTRALNRDSFYADVKSLGKEKITAIMSIDLDGLKETNDTRGHQAGDELLLNTTRVIQKSLYTGCYLYRVGGDEFTILCVNYGEVEVKNLATKILNNIEKAGLSVSLGYAMWFGNKDFEEVYHEADIKMYEMKEINHANR